MVTARVRVRPRVRVGTRLRFRVRARVRVGVRVKFTVRLPLKPSFESRHHSSHPTMLLFSPVPSNPPYILYTLHILG